MQYIKLTDPSLLDERVLDIAVVYMALFCAIKPSKLHLFLPAQLVLLRSYNIEIKRKQMNQQVGPD